MPVIEDLALPPVEQPDVDLPDEVLGLINDLVDPQDDHQMAIGEQPDGAEDAADLEVQEKWKDDVTALMWEHDCYEYYKIEIGIGRNSTPFADFSHTGMSPETDAAMKRIKARRQTFPMVKGLVEAAKILTKIRDEAQELMSYTGHSWLCKDTVHPDVADIIEHKLKPTAAALRVALLARHEAEFRSYMAEIADVLVAANNDLKAKGVQSFDIKKALEHYAAQFPTRKGIKEKLRIRIYGPKLIKKLTAQVEHYAELKEHLAKLRAAKVQDEATQLEIRKLEAQEKLLLEHQEAGKKAIAGAMEWANNKMLDAVSKFLDRFDYDNIKPGELTDKRSKAIKNAMAQIEVMFGKPGTGGFDEIMAQCQQLSGMAFDASKTKEDIDAKIAKLKESLDATVQPESGGTGHRAYSGSTLKRKRSE